MSSILDSLRKSDQKRKNKHTVSIDALKLGNNSGGSGRTRLIFWLILLLLLAAAVFWSWRNGLLHEWLGLSQDADTQPTIELTQNAENTNPENSGPMIMQPAESTDQNNESTAAGNQQQTLAQRPDADAVKQDALQQRLKAAAEQRQREAAQAAPPVGVPEEYRKEAEKSPEEAIAQLEKARQEQKEESLPDRITPVENPQERQQRPQQTKPVENKRSYKLAYELPFSIRKNMPEIKLNIHVYDPDPENRMAVINGLRFGVGDLMEEENIKVQDITQDGVVLEFEGQAFIVPK